MAITPNTVFVVAPSYSTAHYIAKHEEISDWRFVGQLVHLDGIDGHACIHMGTPNGPLSRLLEDMRADGRLTVYRGQDEDQGTD